MKRNGKSKRSELARTLTNPAEHPHTNAVCKAVRELLPDAVKYTRIVGVWVWIEFPSRPDADTRRLLKHIGFHWNKKREAWQHNCGVRRTFNRRGNPKWNYGAVPLKEDSEQRPAAVNA